MAQLRVSPVSARLPTGSLMLRQAGISSAGSPRCTSGRSSPKPLGQNGLTVAPTGYQFPQPLSKPTQDLSHDRTHAQK